MSDPKEFARDLTRKVGEEGRDLQHSFGDQIKSKIEESKNEIVTDVGRALQETITHQVDSLTNYLRNRSAGQLLGDFGRFARRQPVVFIGGAFAVGLLGTRFFKSSDQDQSERELSQMRTDFSMEEVHRAGS